MIGDEDWMEDHSWMRYDYDDDWEPPDGATGCGVCFHFVKKRDTEDGVLGYCALDDKPYFADDGPCRDFDF